MTVEVGKFYAIADNTYEEYGVGEGQIIYTAGQGTVPASKDDPYLFRVVFVAAQVVNGSVYIGEDYKGFTVDGTKLRTLPEEDSEVLQKKFVEDYGELSETTD